MREHVENTRQHFGRDADPAVLNADYNILAFNRCADRDLSAFRRIFGRIRNDIDENLFHPRRIDKEWQLLRRHVPRHLVALLFKERACCSEHRSTSVLASMPSFFN